MTERHPKGRAVTSGEKRAVIERVYASWCAMPEQRLGQLIVNAVREGVFYAEDRTLAEAVEKLAENWCADE